jgi:enamine deaminase RidA (YjgF/YER057c/UK114 family)
MALIGDAPGQLERAVRTLEDALRRANTSLSSVVRLELYLRDIYNTERLTEALRRRMGGSAPSLIIAGAELEDSLEVKLNAIAIAG